MIERRGRRLGNYIVGLIQIPKAKEETIFGTGQVIQAAHEVVISSAWDIETGDASLRSNDRDDPVKLPVVRCHKRAQGRIGRNPECGVSERTKEPASLGHPWHEPHIKSSCPGETRIARV